MPKRCCQSFSTTCVTCFSAAQSGSGWRGVMKGSRITAIGLVAVAGLWIASGHFLPHDSAESVAAVRPSQAPAEKHFRVTVQQTQIFPHAQKLVLSGRTEADRKVVAASRTSGIITEL